MNDEAFSYYVLIYTQDMSDRPEYDFWLISAPVFLVRSKMDFDSAVSYFEDLCREFICVIELSAPYREFGVYSASSGEIAKVMREIHG